MVWPFVLWVAVWVAIRALGRAKARYQGSPQVGGGNRFAGSVAELSLRLFTLSLYSDPITLAVAVITPAPHSSHT